jgi:hypothetical protein
MYGKAISSDPSNMRAKLGVSAVLAARGKREDAVRVFYEALGKDGDGGGADVEGAVKGLMQLSEMGGLDEQGANPQMELMRVCQFRSIFYHPFSRPFFPCLLAFSRLFSRQGQVLSLEMQVGCVPRILNTDT